jgi:hypothetical protein
MLNDVYDWHDEEPENEPDWDPSSGVWFKSEIFTDIPMDPGYDPNDYSNPNWCGRGNILVRVSTNDNLDQGYPTEYAMWSNRFQSLKEAVKDTGGTRRGWNGAKIEVYLDGEVLTEEAAQTILEKEK